MKDFILDLYENDNFVLYLTIALVVLVILFVLVLVFGKKDQKLEETKRLQKIELDKEQKGFKEKKEEPIKLEVKDESNKEIETKEEIKEEENPMAMMASEEDEKEKTPEVTVFEPMEMPAEEEYPPMPEDMPELIKEDSQDEIESVPSFDFDDINSALEQGLNDLENIKNEFNSIEVPKIDEDIPNEPALVEEVREEKTFQPSQVFSSVFVKKDEEENPSVAEEEIKIKNEAPKEEPMLMIQDEEDEDDFVLPTLKVADKPEEKSETGKIPENPEESAESSQEGGSFNFDDLIGETYKIK